VLGRSGRELVGFIYFLSIEEQGRTTGHVCGLGVDFDFMGWKLRDFSEHAIDTVGLVSLLSNSAASSAHTFGRPFGLS
jgi:hypothetical protein